jgi:acyl-CoA synthetase (AMP-forming)/AMP-acid ligase II
LVDAGRLVICGRLKELIIVHGRNHHLEDIEPAAQRIVATAGPLPHAAFAVDGPDGDRLVVVQSAHGGEPPELAALAERIRWAVTAEHAIAVHKMLLVEPGQVPRTLTERSNGRRAVRRT